MWRGFWFNLYSKHSSANRTYENQWNKNFSTQDSNTTEEYYFDENNVETEEYYGGMSFQRSLSERSYEALRFLIQNDAYDLMKKSTD